MGFLEHHFFFACVLVSDFEDAEPEFLREILAALGVQISNTRVPTMPVIGVVRPSVPQAACACR